MQDEYVKKYRPKTIKRLIGKTQRQLAEGLFRSVDEDSPFHRTMFLGPTGVGKTTLAELYTMKLLGDDYDEGTDVLDHPAVIYYNCTEKTGIDSMRELLSSLDYLGLYSDKKIVFFDEMHGLSTAAQESLLVGIEKLPDHVFMISCTTEQKGIKETLRGRFKRMHVQSPSEAEFKKRALLICKFENYTLTEGGFELIYQSCEGSVRVFDEDLESLVKGVHTSADKVEGLTSMVTELIEKDPNNSIPQCFRSANKISDYGYVSSGLVGYAIKMVSNAASGKKYERALLVVEIFGAGLSQQARPRDSFYSLMTSYFRVLRSSSG